MKTMIFSSLMVLSSISVAAATCPQNTQTVYTCKSTPTAGDEEVASTMLDSISICSKGNETLMLVEKNGEADMALATVDMRMGGTSYTLKTPEMDFSLSVVTGILDKTSPARFTLHLKAANISASSTYTCVR